MSVRTEQNGAPRADPPYSQAERERAAALIAAHGRQAENTVTESLIDVLDRGEMDDIVFWLRVRGCIRQETRTDGYTRRLTDKIVIAIEQALGQGGIDLARLLRPAFKAARDQERNARDDRRGR